MSYLFGDIPYEYAGQNPKNESSPRVTVGVGLGMWGLSFEV